MALVVRIPTAGDAQLIARALRRHAKTAGIPTDEAYRAAELALDFESGVADLRPKIAPDTPPARGE